MDELFEECGWMCPCLVFAAPKIEVDNKRSSLGLRPKDGYNMLSEAVQAWEMAMRLQHDLEYAYLHHEDGQPQALEKLHKNPLQYCDSLVESIRVMAQNIVHTKNCEADIEKLEHDVLQVVRGSSLSVRNSGSLIRPRLSSGARESSIIDDGGSRGSAINVNPMQKNQLALANEESKSLPTSRPFSVNVASLLATFTDNTSAASSRDSLDIELSDQRARRRNIESRVYAKRMSSMNNVQGRLKALVQMSENKLGDATITKSQMKGTHIRPTWPEWLHDVTFDVEKKNRLGRRLCRNLHLTEYHILCIRGNKEIRNAIKYTSIISVTMKYPDKIQIRTKNTYYVYYSKVLAHLFHQVKSRMNTRIALEKSGFYYSGMSIEALKGYTVEEASIVVDSLRSTVLRSRQMGDISNAGRDLVNFSENLYRSVLRYLNIDEHIENLKWSDTDIRRLLQVLPNSNDSLVHSEILRILSDEYCAIGNTRKHFMESIKSLKGEEKKEAPEKVRGFIEGMFEHIVTHQWTKLNHLFISGKDEDEGKESKEEKELKENKEKRQRMGAVLAFVIYIAIETSVFVPLENFLFFEKKDEYLSFASDGSNIEPLDRKIIRLRIERPTQELWDIPLSQASRNGWKTAMINLSAAEGDSTPSKRLHALVRTLDSIFDEYKENMTDDSSQALGADDILPIIIYIFVFSDLKRPDCIVDLLWRMCHPEQLQSESGYILTLIESAVSYLESL
jgi:hypothetical protein